MVDNESDQMYGGVDREHSKYTKAVKETIGKVLMQSNRPILAMYSANSGGFTASAKAIFNLSNKNYLIAQKDPQSLKGKMAFWSRSFTSSQISSALGKIGIHCHGITNIRPKKLGPSGRVIRVTIEGKNGSRTFRTRTTLKRALKLPEILFTVTRRKEKYIFDGNGYGHGVGFSQWGGAIMGEQLSAVEIWVFYYPGVTIVKHW
ncbi:SpoIID/LytB domain-containing protein [Candidatus Magnetomorum sp. HK-1]|nr:SpoIID/LytB domain-containing protein [Candidatus Magnetomorum sp. HK-1]